MSKILVPLDGSALAESAVPLATALAQQLRWKICLLTVVQEPDITGSVINSAETYLDGIADAIHQQSGLVAEHSVACGIVASTIVETAAREDVSLIVLSTHGRSGLARAVLGSIAAEVLRDAETPVLLLPAAAAGNAPRQIRRLLAPLDGSELAHTIVGPLIELAGPLGAEVLLLQAAPGPAEFTDHQGRLNPALAEPAERAATLAREYLATVQTELQSAGIQSEILYRLGQPAAVILEVTEAQGIDAIALTTHGRSGLDRLRYGSVAEAVIRQSPVPVLGLGPAAIRKRWRDRWTTANPA